MENKPYKVVYDKNRKLVVTIVPLKESKTKKGKNQNEKVVVR